MSSFVPVFFASLFTGLISIDRAAFGQFQFSRPMVAALFLGILMGCPAEGLLIGLILELLFLDSLPVGSFVPLEPLFPALVSVVMIGTGIVSISALPVALVISLPSIIADRWADSRWRRTNEQIFNRAEAYARLGRLDLVQLQMALAILRAGFFHFLAFFLSCAVLVPAAAIAAEKTSTVSGILLPIALVPLLTGLAAFSSRRIRRGKDLMGFAAGIFLGLLAGLV